MELEEIKKNIREEIINSLSISISVNETNSMFNNDTKEIKVILYFNNEEISSDYDYISVED